MVVPVKAMTAADFAEEIRREWRTSLLGIFRVCDLLRTARAELKQQDWEDLTAALPFSRQTATRLIAVGAANFLRREETLALLPPHWATLYELTKLTEEQFAERIADGTIGPDMERRHIVQKHKADRRNARERELGQKQRALPDKRYGVIVADPEWKLEIYSEKTGMDRSPANHYPTSATQVIAAREVEKIAAADCVLFLWATVPMLLDGLGVMRAWGFTYKSHMIWLKTDSNNKPKLSTGYWFRNVHELILVGTKGALPAPAMGYQPPSLFTFPVGDHSEKPNWLLEQIEMLFPTLPKIELNRRGAPRPGWDAWGNEVEG